MYFLEWNIEQTRISDSFSKKLRLEKNRKNIKVYVFEYKSGTQYIKTEH